MADIVKFPECNKVYVAPDCLDLPAWEGQYPDGQDVIISCWSLSKEELEEVFRTGKVWLHIVGTGQPPVFVGGIRPFIAQPKDN